MTDYKHRECRNDWEDWVDSQDVMIKMHISSLTLQAWRTNGLLPYSQIRGKLYYRKSDILKLLEKNYNAEKGEEEW
jgi:DNA-binding transcriptional MerR regulator